MFIPTFIRTGKPSFHVPIDVRRKLLKWGNGYGIRLTAKEAAALGVKEGQSVHATVGPDVIKNDLSMFPLFHLGGSPPGMTFREEADLAFDEEWGEKEKRIYGKKGRTKA